MILRKLLICFCAIQRGRKCLAQQHDKKVIDRFYVLRCTLLLFFCFVLIFVCLSVCFRILNILVVLRYGSVPSDWEVSSLVMSCFLMRDNVPVKDLSPPARLTFNTSVSTGPLSSLPAVYLPFNLAWKCYQYATRNTPSFQEMLLRYPTRSCFSNKIPNSFTASVIPYTYALHAFFLRGCSKLVKIYISQ